MPAQRPEDGGAVVGIDLGTTNSVVAVNGRVLPLGDRLCECGCCQQCDVDDRPCKCGGCQSCAGNCQTRCDYNDQTECVIRSSVFVAGREFRGFKRHLEEPGVPFAEARFDELVNFSCSGIDGPAQLPSAVELTTILLRNIKNKAEHYLHKPITAAVITVPASFSNIARNATKRAAKQAGINVIRLLNEPTAAALAYGLDSSDGIFLIYDFGGGTFDSTILRIEHGVFQCLATSGSLHLGGDDIDEAILHFCGLANDSANKEQARKMKESGGVISAIAGAPGTKTIDDIAQPFVDKTIAIILNMMRELSFSVAEIDGIVLVGGTSKLNCVYTSLAAIFTETKIKRSVNPYTVVAVGAALHATTIASRSFSTRPLLLDIVPTTLGIETAMGCVEAIIPKYTPTPTSVKMQFSTLCDNQTDILIHVVQGDQILVSNCVSLGRFVLKGLPPLPKGVLKIQVTFSIDDDGILTVEADEESSGVRQELVVDSCSNLFCTPKHEELADLPPRDCGKPSFSSNLRAKCVLFLLFAGSILASHVHAHSRVHAYVVANVKTGKILAQKNANVQCHPASLTKKMTLFLIFSALKRGIITFDTKFPVSPRASSQMSSKLNLKAGSMVTVRTIIEALIVKSANDAAVVAAEGLSGTVEAFAIAMNRAAKSLGMHNTYFCNPSGVPDVRQKTTARDMAILARALFEKFPDFCDFFKLRSFSYKQNKYFTHNHILNTFQGSNGLKTGYIDASGYNLSTSAIRYDSAGRQYHLLVVIIGQKSKTLRDKEAIDLLERFFIEMGALFYDAANGPINCFVGASGQRRRTTNPTETRNRKIVRAQIRTKNGLDVLLKKYLNKRAGLNSRKKFA